ncbi:hypothetical protein Vretifemale_14258 [Volvox reticuliferus]|uniref:Myb-like domain-containing protein n=1 Tax=Volvox reticuliferus TaxID=1737510 RepID=A0A8J4CM55_9CHLO|nr:hypothetical protein Vretifemale_14258 [Volvox reticuliferus]
MVKQTRGYRVWDPASEDALKAGVRKHGLGAWEHIRKDPQFAILSDRTGVQLKDKWRNLVKFRHIDPDEQRTYKPKTQGPWSKKYKRDRTQGLSGTASPVSGDGGGASEDELAHHPTDPQALRQSGRTNAQKRKALSDMAMLLDGDGGELYTASEDDEHAGVITAPGGGAPIVGSSAAIDVPLLGDGTALGSGAIEGEVGLKRSRPRSLGRGSLGRSIGSRHRKALEDRRFGELAFD